MKPLVFAVLILPLVACVPQEECSTEARSSVLVSLTDHNGDPLTEGALVYYSVDDGEDQIAEQLTPGDTWSAGTEEEGIFRIFAEYNLEEFNGCLWWDSAGPVEVEVTSSTCHVETQEIDLVLATNLSDCQDD